MPNKKITPLTTAPKWKYLGKNITKYVHNHIGERNRRRPKQIETFTMFMDWQIQYC